MSILTMTNAPRHYYSCSSASEILREYQQINTPLGSLPRSHHFTASPCTLLGEVLAEMHRCGSDAAVMVNEAGEPCGIFTQRDLLNKVVIPRLSLDIPVSQVMTHNPVTLPTSALGYEAILAMVKGGFHHIILVESGKVVGTVSEHDLFTLQHISMGQIAANIDSADSIEKLNSSVDEIRNLVEYMFIQGIAPDQVTRIISSFNDKVIKRVIDLETVDEDFDGTRLCWIIMGSEGRYEQTISTDQDNGIIFDQPKELSSDKVREKLLTIAKRVNRSLHEIGFHLCKGNVMASNPSCCLSLTEWQKKFRGWILEPTPDSLLNVSIYFDFRAVHGDTGLAEELRSWLTGATIDQPRFLHQMAEIALQKSPPLTFFNNILHEDHPDMPNSIDIKLRGVNVFVDAARLYALALGIPETRTNDRLSLAAEKHGWTDNMVKAWQESFNFLQGVRIRHQHQLKNADGKTPNRLNLCNLNSLEQKVCKEVFKQAGRLQKQLESDFLNNLNFIATAGA